MRVLILSGLLGILSLSIGRPAWAQGETCDPAIKGCCQALEYWTGLDRSSGKRLEVAGDTINPMSDFVAYWNSVGGLEDSRTTRQLTAFVAFLLLFASLIFLFSATARRRRAAGWMLMSVLVALPALAWWALPDLLARSKASAAATEFTNSSLRPLCYEASNQSDLAIGGCSPTVWGNLFDSSDGPRQVLASCNAMPEEAEQLLSGPKSDPCVATCAEAVNPMIVNNADGSSEVSGYGALRARLAMVNEMMGACHDVMSAWRAEKGPSATDWQACADGLAARSYRREIGSDLMLQHAWFGAALGLVLAAFILLVVRRR